MEHIYVLKEITKFNYGKVMFEKYSYYKTNQLIHKAKIKYENIEYERVFKSKEISKKRYIDRTGDEITFESNNGFYNVEYSIFSSKIIE